ncbi:hypothetical protein DFO67_1085 [Modicisalibacter xianhensis]|uniref:Uncharacterized protein n=1 Tax=Modicisalibacter xianhensis TaxID=442341 RepID=A0A4R8FZ86_9GAMM|nr:hypothetical protein DFO67_1085 [Halomonas xianhensis]
MFSSGMRSQRARLSRLYQVGNVAMFLIGNKFLDEKGAAVRSDQTAAC